MPEVLIVFIMVGLPMLFVLFAGRGVSTSSPVAETDVLREWVSGRGAWRDGKLLVMREDAALPDRCVKTNRPAHDRLRFTLYWHHPALYLVLFANPLVYLIVALFIRKKATVEIPVSDAVIRRRRTSAMVGWALGLGGVAAVLVASRGYGTNLAEIGLLAVLAGLFWGVLGTRVVTARKIDGGFVWLSGASREFLELLPDWSTRGPDQSGFA